MMAQRLRMFRPSSRGLAAPLFCALALAISAGTAQAQPACRDGENRVEFPVGRISSYEVQEGVEALRITAAGGKGGNDDVNAVDPVGGPGAVSTGTVSVADLNGNVLQVLVGTAGADGDLAPGGGGGGGSFVGVGTDNAFSAEHLLLVAGGGGGGARAGGAGGTPDGGDGAGPNPGGGGSADGTGGTPGLGAGEGGGATSDGADGSGDLPHGAGGAAAGGDGGNSIGSFGLTVSGGQAAVKGGGGGTSPSGGDGGFGGGGGGGFGGGGGGGGYAGGGGGDINGGGGGGSSFFARNVTDQSMEATNQGDGYVIFCEIPPPAPELTFDREGLDFGEVVVDTSTILNATLQNTGNAPATDLVYRTTSSEFTFDWDLTACSDLDVGERCTLMVAFTPRAPRRVGGSLTVEGDGVSAELALAGTGVPPPTWTISGTITDASEAPLPNVTVRLSGTHTRTATTADDGGYAFSELTDGGTYTVTPRLDGYTFTPASRRLAGLDSNQTANFTAQAVELTISGTVVDEDNQPLAGVTVALSGDAEAEVATDAAGAFAFDGLAWGGTYTVTPTHADYSFAPESQEVTKLEEDTQVAFTATRRTWTISGTIRDASETPLPNVTVTLTGGADANTTTDDEGRYRFEDLTHGDAYIVTPSRDGYTFTPGSQELDALTEDETVDFIAEAVVLTITGTVLDEENAPLAGVTVALSGTTQVEVITADDGAFAFEDLAWGGSYRVTPTHPDYDVQPLSRSFDPLEADQEVTFTATRLTAVYTRYFGEGAIGPFFDTTFTLFNPTEEDASATLSFAGETGEVVPHPVAIPAQTQVIVDPETVLPAAWVGFATAIEADQTLVASRTMRWDDRHYGRHESAGVATAQTEWWFTEGATGTFQLFYLLYNPGDAVAEVTATYYRSGEQPPVTRTYTVGPHTRRTVFVNVAADGVTPDPELGETEVSAHIVSTNNVPIVAERALYLTTNAAQPLTAGTMAPAVTEPAASWHFAEGATAFFDLFLLLANPSTEPVDATVRYLLPTGQPLARTYTLAPESRRTIWVDHEDAALAETQVAISVQSDTPILAERAMWWGARGAWDGGHVSTGATRPATRWGLAGLSLGGPDTAEAYVLIANPNAADAAATLTLVTPDGARSPMTVPLGAWSRTTLRLVDLFPDAANEPVALLVESTAGDSPVPLVVEGAAYASPDGHPLTTGSATPALPLPEMRP